MNPGDIFSIKYEDLTAEPENKMKKIFEFLKMEYKQEYTRLKSPSENLGSAKGKKEIIKQNDQKYLDYLSENKLEKIEQITFPLLEKFGYHYILPRRSQVSQPSQNEAASD